MAKKEYITKIYEPDGSTIVTVLSHKKLAKPPTFSSKINGGQGELKLDLLLPFDDFGEASSIDFDYIVKLVMVSEDYPDGVTLYSGVLMEYEPFANEKKQGVTINCLGLASTLTFDYYKDGSSYTVSHSATDPEDIFKDVLDKHNAVETNALVNYTVSSTESVGVNVDKKFTDKTWYQACEECKDLSSNAGFYWYVDADGVAYFKSKPSTPTHRFIFGKDVISFSAPKTSKEIVNVVSVRHQVPDGMGGFNDATTNREDATSISTFRRRAKIITDSGITAVATAEQRGDKEIADNKDEKIETELVIGSEYNIESIKPGDTCVVRNFKHASQFFSSNMQIVRVSYKGDHVVLSLEEHMHDLGDALDSFING